jgi:hypothetical protein
MDYFWPIFCSVLLLFIMWSVISAQIAGNRRRKARERIRIAGDDNLKVGDFYTIGLRGGEKFERVKFLGFTGGREAHGYLPQPLVSLLIVEQSDGTRAYIRPDSISYYETAAPPPKA